MTGSLFNHLMANSSTTPEVGMGATILMWTDRLAVTIVEVAPNGKRVVVQRDKVTRTDSHGMSDAQSYSYEPGPESPREVYTLRKNGQWVRQGDNLTSGTKLSIGHRSHYHDFSF